MWLVFSRVFSVIYIINHKIILATKALLRWTSSVIETDEDTSLVNIIYNVWVGSVTRRLSSPRRSSFIFCLNFQVAYYIGESSVSGDVSQVQAIEKQSTRTRNSPWSIGYGKDTGGGNTVGLLRYVSEQKRVRQLRYIVTANGSACVHLSTFLLLFLGKYTTSMV